MSDRRIIVTKIEVRQVDTEYPTNWIAYAKNPRVEPAFNGAFSPNPVPFETEQVYLNRFSWYDGKELELGFAKDVIETLPELEDILKIGLFNSTRVCELENELTTQKQTLEAQFKTALKDNIFLVSIVTFVIVAVMGVLVG